MMRKLFIAAACVALAAANAVAQTGSSKSQAQLNAEVNLYFPDQTSGLIIPFNTRQTLLDMIASSASLKFGPSTPQIPNLSTGELYYDSTGAYAEQDSALNVTVDLGASAPPGIIPTTTLVSLSQGNNTTFVGGVGLLIQAKDRSSVTTGNKGVLYGEYIQIFPSVARNHSPFDDATGLVIANQGIAKAADAVFIGNGNNSFGSQWANAIAVGVTADTMLFSNGTFTTGIDLSTATISGNPIHTAGFTVTNQGTVIGFGLQSTAYLVTASPVTLTGTAGTVSAGAPSVIFNPSGTFTATLPAPSTAGLWLQVKTIAAQAVNSASSNVIPLAGGAAGTAILTNTAGKWAILQADGTNWNIMAGN